MKRNRGMLVVAFLSFTILFSMGFLIQVSADTSDPGCTNGDCQPDPGCTNGDCPPDPGCTNGDCPPDPGCTNGDCPPGTVAFKLKGLEIFKGIDIGSVRYGTTFVGRVFQFDNTAHQYIDVGHWKSIIRYIGAKDIEVCGGVQDILSFNLEVILNGGPYAGNRLVLMLNDPSNSHKVDVIWDSIAPICGLCINGSECDCPDSPEKIKSWDCEIEMPDNSGPVATIPYLPLKGGWGTTLDVKEAALYEGLLCHNWAFIPRVGGLLLIDLNE